MGNLIILDIILGKCDIDLLVITKLKALACADP
jgi:hypothetical protein